MYHLSRVVNGFRRALGSAALEESAKNLLNHFEPEDCPDWLSQSDGSWLAMKSPYHYYTVDAGGHGRYGSVFIQRK